MITLSENVAKTRDKLTEGILAYGSLVGSEKEEIVKMIDSAIHITVLQTTIEIWENEQ